MVRPSKDGGKQSEYTVFYPEGSGYIHLQSLGKHGDASIVRSIKNGQLYFRRKRIPGWQEPGVEWEEIDEFKYCRTDINGLNKRVAVQAICHLTAKEKNERKVMSVASIYEYCNGGSLRDLLTNTDFSFDKTLGWKGPVKGLRKDQDLEIFVWHLFKRMIDVFCDLAQFNLAHTAYDCNVLLNFPTGATKFPEICVGSPEEARSANTDAFEDSLMVIWLNVTCTMYRSSYDRHEIGWIDLFLAESKPKFSKELLECHEMLGNLCGDKVRATSLLREIEKYLPTTNKGTTTPNRGPVTGARLLKTHIQVCMKRLHRNLSPLPDLSMHWRDRKSAAPPVAKLFHSRVDLFKYCAQVPQQHRPIAGGGLASSQPGLPLHGPFRVGKINRIDAKSGNIVAVEKTEWNLHEPIGGALNKEWYLEVPPTSKLRNPETSLDDADYFEPLLKLAAEQDKADKDGAGKVTHKYFEVDNSWNLARLTPKIDEFEPDLRPGSGKASAKKSGSPQKIPLPDTLASLLANPGFEVFPGAVPLPVPPPSLAVNHISPALGSTRPQKGLSPYEEFMKPRRQDMTGKDSASPNRFTAGEEFISSAEPQVSPGRKSLTSQKIPRPGNRRSASPEKETSPSKPKGVSKAKTPAKPKAAKKAAKRQKQGERQSRRLQGKAAEMGGL